MDMLTDEVQQLQKTLLHHRRRLHSFAECGFDLPQTTRYVKNTLLSLGYEPRICGRSGILCDIGTEKGDGILLLRADMDALPIKEDTRLSYRAENGNMHACGHDLHTAMLLGAAALIGMHRTSLPRPVRLLFQPAEELLLGAQDVCRAGVLSGVDAAFMVHTAPAVPYPTGTVLLPQAGAGAPAACFFSLEVFGESAHGAVPSAGCDAIFAASELYKEALDFAKRQREPLLLTVGSFEGGHAPNVIADHARFCGSFRSFSAEQMEGMKKKLLRLANAAKKKYGTVAQVHFEGACPVLQNDPSLLSDTKDLLTKLRIPYTAPKVSVSASEDFAVIAERVPALTVAIAAGRQGHGYDLPLHHPSVLFDEDALPIGAALYAAFALQTFTKGIRA